MRLKALAILALLMQLAFATASEWQGLAGTALVAALGLLGVLYAIAMAFSLQDLKFLCTEEAYQLIVTAVMVAVLFSAEAVTNEFFAPIAPNLQEASLSKINANLQTHLDIFNQVKDYMVKMVPQSTKSLYCGLNGAGFSISPCGSFSSLIPPLTMSMQALSLSLAELSSLSTLASFGKVYAFTLLLPMGILLRTLRFTRGAGALFIGLAVSLYLFLPLAAIFMDEVTSPAPNVNALSFPDPDCNVNRYSTEIGFDYSNADEATSEFNSMLGKLDSYLYVFLVRGTMVTIVSLLALYTAFKWVSKLAGAEVDISALMRIS